MYIYMYIYISAMGAHLIASPQLSRGLCARVATAPLIDGERMASRDVLRVP